MKKIFLAFVFLLSFSITSFAGLSIVPAKTEISMPQNRSYVASYTVQNTEEETVTVSVTTKNWNNSKENKGINVDEWLIVDKSPITLEPQESKEVKFTVKSGDLKGTLSGMISFTLKSSRHTGINLMTSVPVYMTIEGTQNISFDFKKIEIKNARNQRFEKTDMMDIIYEVQNNGNVHLRLQGGLKIFQGKKLLIEQKINELNPVYPDSSRSFFERVKALPKGKYSVNIFLNAFDKKIEKSIQFKIDKHGEISY